VAEIKAVAEPTPDPKIGKPRPKSGVSFPYYDLDKSVAVAKVMHEKAGGACDRAQLAALLQYSGVKNGGFLSRVAAVKMFGFVGEENGKLSITKRGLAAVAPISDGDADRARYEAFLAIELFKKVFDKFNGQTLPAEAGLTNLLLNEYKVVNDRVAPTLKIMLDSAESAGLFKATGNRTRMVAPIFAASTNLESAAQSESESRSTNDLSAIQKAPLGGRGNGGEPPDIHPAILGLLRELPPAGTTISDKKRASLIAAFTGLIGYIYPEKDDL
jgi:hypothetical protein